MKTFVKMSAAILALSFAGTAAFAGQGDSAKELSPQTKANLETAMHGEAFANLKYQRYADQADEKGQSELAQLFRDSANIEANEHFDREAEALQLGSSSDVNLEDAMAGEHYENTKMYVEFATQAEADGDMKVAAMFRQIAVDEGVHYDAYKAALARLKTK
ncbi:MAG: rubrerythrin family protein [Parasphingorhabdus sp.]|uniref:rubrerythrin family protein n=1 Tax=Parasphingorhabdus sp. TaxID=2709688 RepID=UPI0030014050|tara:strand:- start:1337 stop:1819 length:483 start_codon:yes stop_codon:yes gene_type:complete